jgi:hypothetical protein
MPLKQRKPTIQFYCTITLVNIAQVQKIYWSMKTNFQAYGLFNNGSALFSCSWSIWMNLKQILWIELAINRKFASNLQHLLQTVQNLPSCSFHTRLAIHDVAATCNLTLVCTCKKQKVSIRCSDSVAVRFQGSIIRCKYACSCCWFIKTLGFLATLNSHHKEL